MDFLAGDEADRFEKETDETKRSVKIMLKSKIFREYKILHFRSFCLWNVAETDQKQKFEIFANLVN